MQYGDEAELLKKSSWPRCDQIAEALSHHGHEALEALQYASKSRTHHVRSACLRAIQSIDSAKGHALAEIFLTDRAYEVRETAAKILGVAVPG